MSKNITYQSIAKSDRPERLDKLLPELVSEVGTRSQLKQRFVSVLVNDRPAALSSKVQTGDLIKVTIKAPELLQLIPEEMTAKIIFENKDVLVVAKPHGMVVHPAPGNHHGTLLHGVAGHIRDHEHRFTDLSLRPGVVHRLDKDTSGVIILAKHPVAHEHLSQQFARRQVKKLYLAFAKGNQMPDFRLVAGRIATRIARDPANRKRFKVIESSQRGKDSLTFYQRLSSAGPYHCFALFPQTGRTHQLRVHMRHIGCPILGDPIYSRPDKQLPPVRLMLHAAALSIMLPGEPNPRLFIEPVPTDWYAMAKRLELTEIVNSRGFKLDFSDMGWYESLLQSLKGDPSQGR